MDFEQQLHAAFVPCDPRPELRTTILARRSALRRPGKRSGRGSRTILFGVLIAVAVAAAMLASHLMQQPAIQPDPVPAVVADPLSPPTSPAPPLAQEKPAVVEAIPVVKPFTVSVEFRNEAEGAAVPAVEMTYAALLDNLRAVPGLTLIEQGRGDAAPTTTADYRLSVTGSGPMTGSGTIVGGRFTVRITGNPIELPGTGTIARRGFGASGDIATPLEPVASLMAFLRGSVLPPDPADVQRLQDQLLDSTQGPRERMNTLIRLLSLEYASAGRGASSPDSTPLRGAIELATSATDPALRAHVWRTLRGLRKAELGSALIGSLRADSSVEVRLEAMASLRTDFADDALTRKTLEHVAREDAHPLVRAVAQRALTGDAAWKQYIVSSLEDATRPAAERIEAFAYEMYGMFPGSRSMLSPLIVGPWSRMMMVSGHESRDRKVLDAGMIQALSSVLPDAMNLPSMATLKARLPTDLMAAGPPGVVALLGMVKHNTDPGFKSNAMNQLKRGSSDPDMRTALERISTSDPDAQLRQLAADVLKATDAP